MLILTSITLACLTPFLNKAFHIDDPLFLWSARQIQSHPADFYGFSLNWYGFEMPMSEVTKNPPIASYYIALVTFFGGWNEIVVHLAFLVPALSAVLGIYYLAGELCPRPMTATLASIFTPVFLLSGTTVMSDMMMTAFWVWAIYLWIRGIKHDSVAHLLSAAFLVAVCSLTKYYGMSLIPLLFAYSLAHERRPGLWTLILMLPILPLAGYHLYTYALYGRGLLLDASAYALGGQDIRGLNWFSKTLRGLSFTGGCLASVLFYSILSWRRTTFWVSAFVSVLCIVGLNIIMNGPDSDRFYSQNGVDWLFVIHLFLFSFTGIMLLFFAASDLWQSKDPDSLLLFLWVMGTFIFLSFLNWSANGRSVLPMAPAAGILLLRSVDKGTLWVGNISHLLLPLIPSLIISLCVTWADYKLAETARIAAVAVNRDYGNKPGTLWFQGHWGFQYYMQASAGKPLDFRALKIAPGDLVVNPSSNTNVSPLSPDSFILIRTLRVQSAPFITTMNHSVGAGFHSDVFGPLPFAAGPVPAEAYQISMARHPL
jgi:4-amino-4-deoxy-L-arabinose transferase-like glycosyltransferase